MPSPPPSRHISGRRPARADDTTRPAPGGRQAPPRARPTGTTCERRGRILVVSPSLGPPGGGNGVAAWTAEALKDTYEVTALTWHALDLEVVNRHFGTALAPGDVRHRRVPAAARLVEHAPLPLGYLKQHLLERAARAEAPAHDLAIGIANEIDLGRPGLQYVHYPFAAQRPAADFRWYHGSAGLNRAYFRACEAVCGYSRERMLENRFVVNSAYIAGLVRELYGRESTVLHPPAPGDFPAVPWEARDDGVVVLGRVSPEKNLDAAFDVVEGLRAHGHPVVLHVVGVPDDPGYVRRVAERTRHSPWASLHLDLPRTELVRLVSRQRWGLHTMAGEHYGMAVAEMVQAGCIVFVPDQGGPREIVGDEPRLRFGSVPEAVATMAAVLDDPATQATLRAHLAARRATCSTQAFVTGMRTLVAEALGEPAARGARSGS